MEGRETEVGFFFLLLLLSRRRRVGGGEIMKELLT